MAAGVAMAVIIVDLTLRTRPEDGLMFLLALPVGIIALQHGRRAAILAVLAAAAIHAGTASLQHEELGVLGYGTRMLMFGVAAGGGVAIRRSPVAGQRSSAPAAAQAPPEPSAHNLTPRELEVLRLIACGHTNKEAALELRISVRTIESHRARIQEKLACGGRSDLYRRAQELGLIAA